MQNDTSINLDDNKGYETNNSSANIGEEKTIKQE